jgi:predicted membrane channel-forming protein YqfA (hemolysin III family)
MRPEDNNVTAASSMTGSATGPQTEEHRKTGRAGYLVLGCAVVFMAITALSFALGYSAIWWTTAGICVALFIVGILLVLESERQRQRRDKVVSRRLWPWNVTRHR